MISLVPQNIGFDRLTRKKNSKTYVEGDYFAGGGHNLSRLLRFISFNFLFQKKSLKTSLLPCG